MAERQPKAVCPHCQHWDSNVTDGWPDPRGGYVRRRRCTKCRKNFHTIEKTHTLKVITISRSHLHPSS
jgi:transcriptional regulator NrdR family protein